MKTQQKKLPKLKAATSQKLLQACEINDLRKNYNKLWVDVMCESIFKVYQLRNKIMR